MVRTGRIFFGLSSDLEFFLNKIFFPIIKINRLPSITMADSLISFLKGVSVETEIPLNPPLKFRGQWINQLYVGYNFDLVSMLMYIIPISLEEPLRLVKI